jgi:hypothetical protein
VSDVETFELHSSGAAFYLASNGLRVQVAQYDGHSTDMRTLLERAWVVEQTIKTIGAADKLETALGLREGEAP